MQLFLQKLWTFWIRHVAIMGSYTNMLQQLEVFLMQAILVLTTSGDQSKKFMILATKKLQPMLFSEFDFIA